MENLTKIFGTQLDFLINSDYLWPEQKEIVRQIIKDMLQIVSDKVIVGNYANYDFSAVDAQEVKYYNIPSCIIGGGFINVYSAPDGVTIIENGVGSGSQTFKFALKAI